MRTRMNTKSTESGFALLITLIVVGVVLSVGLTILELSIKQVRLSTNAKDSEVSFHAANAGMECARYWRRVSSTEMETYQDISPECFGSTISNYSKADLRGDGVVNGDGETYLYKYDFTWGSTGGERCTRVITMVSSTTASGIGATTSNISDYIPGFPTEDDPRYCEPGARCTVISARGYNRACTVIGSGSTYGIVEREVLLQF
jgi:Tfp pilus assembly protein PilX